MTSKIYSIDEIKRIVCPVAVRYGAERVFLFGSYARGTATENSDIDFRLDKGRIKGFFAVSGFRADLIDAFNKEIDLLTTGSLSAEFLNEIEREEILIYGQK